ncbi:60S ribosomal protein L7 [Pelomyxa schiedti]|nr:60S ribosomal protein L7 [Pelomyxa schiedti]
MADTPMKEATTEKPQQQKAKPAAKKPAEKKAPAEKKPTAVKDEAPAAAPVATPAPATATTTTTTAEKKDKKRMPTKKQRLPKEKKEKEGEAKKKEKKPVVEKKKAPAPTRKHKKIAKKVAKVAAPATENKDAAAAPATEAKPADKKKADVVPMPESIKKIVKARIERLAKTRAAKKTKVQKQAETEKKLVGRAAKWAKEYKARERSLIQKRRDAKLSGNFFREPDARLIFVIRLKGICGLTPRTRKILKLLRLKQINNASFVRVNKATLQMLQLVQPYVAFGYPNLSAVRTLMYKRGYCRIHRQRQRITDNKMISAHLGKHDIICMEDLIHEIYTVGKHFTSANKFLAPFKLKNPKGGFRRKSILYTEGGDGGNREELINKLIRRMV